MKVAGYVLVAILAAAASSLATWRWKALADRNDSGLTVELTEKLNSREVAQRVLPQLSSEIIENVVDVAYTGAVDPQSERTAMVEDVTFRLRGSSAGWRGICMSNNLSVSLALNSGQRGEGGDTTAPDGGFRTYSTFHVIDDTSTGENWSDEYEATLDRRCAALPSGTKFFVMPASVDLRTVADMIPVLSALDADSIRVVCNGDRTGCRADAKRFLRARPWGEIAMIDPISDCSERQSCLEMLLADHNSPNDYWVVRARGEYKGTHPNGWGKLALTDVELERNQYPPPID